MDDKGGSQFVMDWTDKEFASTTRYFFEMAKYFQCDDRKNGALVIYTVDCHKSSVNIFTCFLRVRDQWSDKEVRSGDIPCTVGHECSITTHWVRDQKPMTVKLLITS